MIEKYVYKCDYGDWEYERIYFFHSNYLSVAFVLRIGMIVRFWIAEDNSIQDQGEEEENDNCNWYCV